MSKAVDTEKITDYMSLLPGSTHMCCAQYVMCLQLGA